MQIYLSFFTGKFAQFLPAGLFSLEIVQFWAAVSYSTCKLCNPSRQPTHLPPRNAHFFPQLSRPMHVPSSCLVPSRTEQNRFACMDYFSQGSMQRHPLIQGSIFSNWRLHARIISKTSRQVFLFLDLWHTCHNLDSIETHEMDIVELIPHIKLATLTSQIASRSR